MNFVSCTNCNYIFADLGYPYDVNENFRSSVFFPGVPHRPHHPKLDSQYTRTAAYPIKANNPPPIHAMSKALPAPLAPPPPPAAAVVVCCEPDPPEATVGVVTEVVLVVVLLVEEEDEEDDSTSEVAVAGAAAAAPVEVVIATALDIDLEEVELKLPLPLPTPDPVDPVQLSPGATQVPSSHSTRSPAHSLLTSFEQISPLSQQPSVPTQ